MPEDLPEFAVQFFTEAPLEFELQQPEILRAWLHKVAEDEKQAIESLSYIFCTDDYLLEMNRQYLDHDYFTDVITFDNRENSKQPVIADVFISYDRVKENAATFSAQTTDELHRVMAHGLLHLLGYGDKTEAEQKLMREKENHYLTLR